MAARRYLCTFPAQCAGTLSPFPGASLRFEEPDSGRPVPIYLTPAMDRAIRGTVAPDRAGAWPAIFLDPRRPYRVVLLAANGSEVAAQALAAGATGPVSPDDAGLFRNIGEIAIPAGTDRIRSEGWATPGQGSGLYVSDVLATADLARQHPRCCATTANGRHFRLDGSSGLITVEQAGAWGDPAGHDAVDDREAFQAAIDYARAIGVTRIGLAQSGYSLWMTARHSPVAGGFDRVDGHGLVIAPNQQAHFIGLGQLRSRLSFRAPDGQGLAGERSSAASRGYDSRRWRGSGFFIAAADPIGHERGTGRGSLTLEHLVVDGGTRRTADSKIAAGGEGWDITHKGVFMQADRKGADIVIRDSEVTGWRGETIYASNDPDAMLVVRDSRFSHSNGQGLNPNGCRVDVDGCVIEDCFIGIEGWTGAHGGRIVRTQIIDCFGVRGKSGTAVSLQGGIYGRSPRSHFYAPTRDDSTNPVGTIDITCRNCGPARLGWWLEGALTLIDTTLVLGAYMNFNEGSQHLDLDIALVTDHSADAYILIAGGAGKAGDRLTDNVTIRATSSATGAAAAAGLKPQAAVVWRGSLGPDIHVSLSGRPARNPPHATGPVPDFAPHIR